jgi:phosphate starvation-inducible PhoH-like protein
MNDTTLTLTFTNNEEAIKLFGHRDQFLRLIRDALNVRIIARGDTVQIDGEPPHVEQADRVFSQLRQLVQRQEPLTSESVRKVLATAQAGDIAATAIPAPVAALANNRSVRPRTNGQARYVEAMKENDIVFAVGPAGTGKTYLAVGMAVNMLRQGAVRRIVLVRPAVEAGEKLGFLPGDITAKINPYLRPLFDGLNEMMEPEQVKRYMEGDVIEIAPLAFMRGRTLNQSVIILDEGQNTTIPQMKMFLTRMGHGSKIIVTGDITQIDLPREMRSGLIDAIHRLDNLDRVGIIYLDEHDIVRHPLVQKIVRAYEDDKPRRKRSD